MSEKARWAKLAGLPKSTDKQQLDENFVGTQMVGNIFDREKEQYEDAFEHFLSERYEEKVKIQSEDRKAKEYIKSIEDKDERESERKRMFDADEEEDDTYFDSEGNEYPNITHPGAIGNTEDNIIDLTDMPLEDIDEDLVQTSDDRKKVDAISLKTNILRSISGFNSKEELKNHILGLIDNIDDKLFGS
jgi:hypothetical protein